VPNYAVTITAKVTKTYNIGAPDEDKAVELAHQLFTVAPEGGDEHYDQDTDDVVMQDHEVPLDGEWEDDT
jgi:hypothetical protein